MVGLGDLAGGSFSSQAFGINADGSVIVGQSSSASGAEAFRWTQAGGMVGLGDLAGGSFLSYAYGVNTDGSVIVGHSSSASGTEAFRWTQAGGMVGLGDLAGGSFYSRARGVNADGSVVVGQSNSANGPEAFIAKAGQGMIGLTDFTTSLESMNEVLAKTIANVSMLLHETRGHLGNRRDMDAKEMLWVAGDISRNNRHSTKDEGYTGEVGIRIQESEQWTYSVALGKMMGESKLAYKGLIDADGNYITVDTDIKLFSDIPLYSTTTLIYGKNDVTIKRGYDNAGVLTHSRGDTQQSFIAFKQRLQYQFDTFMPYVQMNHIKVTQDAYGETGGGFPARYDTSKESITDWLAGIDANVKLNDSNTLITTLEAVHRVQKRGNGVSYHLKTP